MRRYHRDPAILQAAESWRDRCLLDDGSVLSEKRLWTAENLTFLDRYFVQNLDEGEGGFLDKLEGQLQPAPVAAKQLAAELLWILYLGVSEEAIKGGTKRLQIKRVWEWSGDPVPDAPEAMAALERGIAHPGTAYQTHRWREFAFAIQLFHDWKRLPHEEQNRLIGDPWSFAIWIEGLSYSASRQFRHFMLALLFPEHFERSVTGSDKRLILRTFRAQLQLDAEAVDYTNRVSVDRALFDLRERLEAVYDEDPLDYYQEPLRAQWLPKKRSGRAIPQSTVNEDEKWIAERFGDARVWAMGAGEGARLWPEFRDGGFVAFGLDELGDLGEYETKAELGAELIAARGEGNPVNDIHGAWQFANEMREGDWLVMKQGGSVLLGYGVVTSDYRYDDERSEYQHVRSAEWKRIGRWPVEKGREIATKTLTEVGRFSEWTRMAFELMDGIAPTQRPAVRESGVSYRAAAEYTVDDALEDVFLTKPQLTRILDALGRKRNVILEGAPGVGKTFVARRIAWALLGKRDNTRVEMVQFHQSYAYEDFVQGWRPSASGGFELRDGVFHQFCRRAQEDPDNPYVFIIDEINRGNLSKVLGELMLLMESDKRGPDYAIPLTYSRSPDDRFYVPGNVYLLGMMNTADRSLAMVDYALRRRFSFIRLEPAFGSEGFTNYLVERGVPEPLVDRIVRRMSELNRTIAEDTHNLGPGFEIGHSFFVPTGDEETRDEAWYERVVRQEIEPLLHEYWFDRPERVEEHVARLLA